MTEDKRPRPTRNGRPRSRPASRPGAAQARNGARSFVTQKQPTPPWIVAVFIGVPSVVILILAGLLVKNLVTSSGEVVEEAPPVAQIEREAEKLVRSAVSLKAEGKELQDKGEEKRAFDYYKRAIKKAREAQQLYKGILDDIRVQEGLGEDDPLSEEYAGYEVKMTRIQQIIQDIIRMMGIGI